MVLVFTTFDYSEKVNMVAVKNADIIAGLQTDILRMQGFKPATSSPLQLGLGPIASCFPNGAFPIGAVHELLCERTEDSACSIGFISGLLSGLMGNKGITLWISADRKLFPPALSNFGVVPHHVVFVDVKNEKDVLWAMDEALKCSVITSVVAEVKEISFNESRKLQLAVEQSKATGFLVRKNYKKLNSTACVSRWKVSSLPSDVISQMPGIGFPKWKVELLRMRNGKTGSWDVQWRNSRFYKIEKHVALQPIEKDFNVEIRKVG